MSSTNSTVLTNPSVERVRGALARAGLSAEIVELPGAARTAQAAADFLGCALAQIANSLVFRAQSIVIPGLDFQDFTIDGIQDLIVATSVDAVDFTN